MILNSNNKSTLSCTEFTSEYLNAASENKYMEKTNREAFSALNEILSGPLDSNYFTILRLLSDYYCNRVVSKGSRILKVWPVDDNWMTELPKLKDYKKIKYLAVFALVSYIDANEVSLEALGLSSFDVVAIDLLKDTLVVINNE